MYTLNYLNFKQDINRLREREFTKLIEYVKESITLLIHNVKEKSVYKNKDLYDTLLESTKTIAVNYDVIYYATILTR